MKRAFCVLGVLTALTSQTALAQEAVSPAEPALEELLTAKPAQIAPQTAKDALADALTQTESFACSEMMTFLQDTVLKDPAVMRAAETRNAADVAAVTAKYAIGAAKDLNADYLFYMPNPRFFVRVNDKNYRGRSACRKIFPARFPRAIGKICRPATLFTAFWCAQATSSPVISNCRKRCRT